MVEAETVKDEWRSDPSLAGIAVDGMVMAWDEFGNTGGGATCWDWEACWACDFSKLLNCKTSISFSKVT